MRIHDLARHLNVSIGTVSRALNGKPDVNPNTRQRVLDAARRLGYQPNQSGRSLRRGNTDTVAFLMEVGAETTDEGAAFFMTVHRGAQSVLAPAGYDYVVLMGLAEEDATLFLQRVIGRQLADGYILSETKRDDPRIGLLRSRNIPFVSLGRSGAQEDCDWIDIDFEAIVRSSVRLLARAGHRRVAITLPAGAINYGAVALNSFRAALAEHGLAFSPDLVIRGPLHGGGGRLAAQAFTALEPRPTALLLLNDLMAEGVYAGLRGTGLEPGRDVSVVGFRAIPQNEGLVPALTSYRMSVFELGQAVGARLLRHLPGAGASSPSPSGSGGLWPFEIALGASHLWGGRA